MPELIRRFRYHLAVFFAVIGPGFITAVVDNDSGGIFTYSAAGARYGYLPLWTLLPITVVLIITQEMCSRMGAVTGKGLSDLIREEFGLRITFLLMAVLVLANMTNVMAEFAGVASSLELFHISRYISVPLAAFAVWFLVVKGSYQSVEKIFLFACVFYVTYVISGFLVKPDWKEAALYSVKPVLLLEPGYIYMLIGMVGTTIAPWMQFYLQAAVVEKGVTAKEYKKSRIEVIVGCFMTSVIAFFIIVACAGAIYSVRPRDIQDASEAALGLKPFGEYAFLLFSAGLFNASIFAACILRRPRLRSRRQQAAQGRAHLLLAVHPADRGRRRGHPDPQVPAGADDPALPGAQRHPAALRPHLHGAVDQQGGHHGRMDQFARLQPRLLGNGGDHDRPHPGAGRHHRPRYALALLGLRHGRGCSTFVNVVPHEFVSNRASSLPALRGER